MEEEIRLLLVMDRERNRPLYFRYMPGSILDVSSAGNDKQRDGEALNKIVHA